MEKRRWGLILLCLVGCVALFTGCSGKYFAKVEGVKLSVSDLNKKYAKAEAVYKPQYETYGYDFDDDLKKELKSVIAHYMIMNEVIGADFKAHKWNDDVAEVKKDIQDSKDRQGEDDFKKYLDSLGMTEKQLLRCLAHYYYVTKDVEVSEADVRQYYINNLDNPNFRDLAESVTVRHILVETEEEAKEVLSRLKAGEDFAELAQEKSIDPGLSSNGGVYTDIIRGEMVTEFEEAAFSLEVNKISDPVKTDYGYHIIEVLEHKPGATAEDFDNYRDMMQEYALQEAKDTLYGTVYSDLMGNAKIEYSAGYEYLNTEEDQPTPETEVIPNIEEAQDNEPGQ